MKNSKRDAAHAYHEAGHVVVSWCLGVRVRRASIVPDEDSTGHVQNEREKPSTGIAVDRGDRWHPSRLRAEKWVMILQAGEVAQRWYNSCSVRRGHSQSDFKKCVDILRMYAPDEKKLVVEPHYLLLRNWTIYLIVQHWHLVEAVANALLDRRELSGTQVLDVIRTANQKPTSINVQPLLDAVEIIRQRRKGSESGEDAQ
jgi:hypothetical protein